MRAYDTRPLLGRLEDVEWLTDTDETLTTAATRLGVTRRGLYRWLRSHGHTDILTRLTEREADNQPWSQRHLNVAHPNEGRPVDQFLMTSQEVMAYAGITYRQLDYWTRTKILQPYTNATPGSGSSRLFDGPEADVALTMRRLIEAGLEPRLSADLAHQLLAGETPRIGMFRLVPIPGDLAHPHDDEEQP